MAFLESMASRRQHFGSILFPAPSNFSNMKTNDLLANVRVASPCTARWGHMAGDEQARFCAQCSKHVYNLSAMTAEAATALIREKEGQLCARFYQRADGTMLTADCPVGAARGWSRLKHLIWSGATAAIMAVAGVWRGQAAELPKAKMGEVGVKGAPRELMGDVCVTSRATNTPPIMGIICVPPMKTNVPPVKR